MAINGSNLFVYVGIDKVAGSTSYTLNAEMNKLNKASNDSGFFADHISGIGTWDLSTDNLLIYDGYNYSQLFEIFANRQTVYLTIGGESGINYIGQAYIESISKSSPLEEVPKISVSFKGIKELYQTDLPLERFIIDELFEIIIDQFGNNLVYT